MKILHFMVSGEAGGIEVLNKDYAKHSKLENIYFFFWQSGCIAEEMRNSGNNIIELNASKADFFGPLKSVFDVCEKVKPAAIVVHYKAPVLYLYAMILKKKYPYMKIFAYVHENVGNPPEKLKKGLRSVLKELIIRRFFQKADGMIAISEFVKKAIIKCCNIPEQKIKMIYNGIDINRFQMPLHVPEEQRELIYVGRLVAGKGVQNTIHALAKLSEDICWHFSIVGEGDFRSELEKLVMQYQLESKIEFLGKRRDIPQLLSQSDIFVHVPYAAEGEEGFGIALVEAMAAGLVCVCGKSGAIPEIISNNESGYLVKNVKSDELSEKLTEIIENIDSAQMKQLRNTAREKARFFSIESYTEKLDNFFVEKCT